MTTETTRAQDKLIQLADYTPPAFLIETVHLDIDIRSDGTVVKSRLAQPYVSKIRVRHVDRSLPWP